MIPRPHARCFLAHCETSSWYLFWHYRPRPRSKRLSNSESFPNCLLIYTDIWNRFEVHAHELVADDLTEYVVVGVKMTWSNRTRRTEPNVAPLEMAGIAPFRNFKVQCELGYLFKAVGVALNTKQNYCLPSSKCLAPNVRR